MLETLQLKLYLHTANELTHCGLVTPYGVIDLGSSLAQVMAFKSLKEPVMIYSQ